MNGYIFLIIVFIAIMIALIVILFSTHIYKEQKEVVKGKNYRRKIGEFTFEKYIESKTPVKQHEWLKQKNAGTTPESYDKEIKYINHLGSFHCLVSKKGL